MDTSQRTVEHEVFPDHNSEAVISTWLQYPLTQKSISKGSLSSRSSLDEPSEKLPILVYTSPEIPGYELHKIPLAFLALGSNGNPDHNYEVQVISAPQPDVFACIEHYRREKAYRKYDRHHLPSSYSRAPLKHSACNHSNFLIYLDRHDWRQAGPVFVSFGLGRLQQTFALEDDVAAQSAINRGRVKLKATRMRNVDDIRETLGRVFDTAGGCEWDSPARSSSGIDVTNKFPTSTTCHGRFLELATPLESILRTHASSDPVHVLTLPDATSGHPFTTVWSARHGPQIPSFPFLLYLPGTDDDPLPSEDLAVRIFRALDLDILQELPWRLECYNHLPTLEAAAAHFKYERAIRSAATVTEQAFSRRSSSSSEEEQDDRLHEMKLPPIPPSYANAPYQRFNSVLLVADATVELSSHLSLLLFDPAEKPLTEQEDGSAEDLVELVKFRLGYVGLPSSPPELHLEGEERRDLIEVEEVSKSATPRLSRVLFALWDICEHRHAQQSPKRGGRPRGRSINEVLWF